MREKIEYLDAEEYGSINNYIYAIENVIYPQVRKLESDYKELEDKIDDVLLQENQSLKEQIKILAHITYTYNPDVDISIYLRHLKTEDYQLFIENNKTEEKSELENKLKIAVEQISDTENALTGAIDCINNMKCCGNCVTGEYKFNWESKTDVLNGFCNNCKHHNETWTEDNWKQKEQICQSYP